MKKINKNDPLKIKNRVIGINKIELIILFKNSSFIKYYQNFFLFF